MNRPIYRFCRFLCLVWCKLFFRLQVCGKEHLPASGGFLIASNHQSYLDPILVGVSCPQDVCYMARHDLFKIPGWGWLLYKVGAFPVRRNTADRSALKEALRRVRSGLPLIVFPEGTRSEAAGQLQEPQAGVGFLAQKLAVQVVPVYVSGSDKAWPRHAKLFRPHKVKVCIGEPFYPAHGLSYADTAVAVMDAVRRTGQTHHADMTKPS